PSDPPQQAAQEMRLLRLGSAVDMGRLGVVHRLDAGAVLSQIGSRYGFGTPRWVNITISRDSIVAASASVWWSKPSRGRTPWTTRWRKGSVNGLFCSAASLATVS